MKRTLETSAAEVKSESIKPESNDTVNLHVPDHKSEKPADKTNEEGRDDVSDSDYGDINDDLSEADDREWPSPEPEPKRVKKTAPKMKLATPKVSEDVILKKEIKAAEQKYHTKIANLEKKQKELEKKQKDLDKQQKVIKTEVGTLKKQFANRETTRKSIFGANSCWTKVEALKVDLQGLKNIVGDSADDEAEENEEEEEPEEEDEQLMSDVEDSEDEDD